jgi:hypothetical protein
MGDKERACERSSRRPSPSRGLAQRGASPLVRPGAERSGGKEPSKGANASWASRRGL